MCGNSCKSCLCTALHRFKRDTVHAAGTSTFLTRNNRLGDNSKMGNVQISHWTFIRSFLCSCNEKIVLCSTFCSWTRTARILAIMEEPWALCSDSSCCWLLSRLLGYAASAFLHSSMTCKHRYRNRRTLATWERPSHRINRPFNISCARSCKRRQRLSIGSCGCNDGRM